MVYDGCLIIQAPQKRLFACPTTFSGRGRSVGFLLLLSSPSFSHEISVGRSGFFFKNFVLFKKKNVVKPNLGQSVGKTFYFLLLFSPGRAKSRSVGKTFLLFKNIFRSGGKQSFFNFWP